MLCERTHYLFLSPLSHQYCGSATYHLLLFILQYLFSLALRTLRTSLKKYHFSMANVKLVSAIFFF